jgi:hypothetical protein
MAPAAPAAAGHPRLSRAANAANAVLMFAVALPSLWFAVCMLNGLDGGSGVACTAAERGARFGDAELWTPAFWGSRRAWCAVGHQRPMLMANILFALNVDALFWLISLAQRSTWLIDPYWTLLPPLIALFYKHHPAAAANSARSFVSMALLWTWSARLTYSYFRRCVRRLSAARPPAAARS